MSDNAAPILSRADTVNLISALRFRDRTDDERAAIHLKLTTTDAELRIEVRRLTESRDAVQRDYRLLTEYDQRTAERIEAVTGCKNFADLLIYCSDISALRAELEAVKQGKGAEYRKAYSHAAAELGKAQAERDRQYEFNAGQIAKYAALEAEHAESVTALYFVRSRLMVLRHEACNDELHELSDELTGVLSVIDASISATTAEPEDGNNA